MFFLPEHQDNWLIRSPNLWVSPQISPLSFLLLWSVLCGFNLVWFFLCGTLILLLMGLQDGFSSFKKSTFAEISMTCSFSWLFKEDEHCSILSLGFFCFVFKKMSLRNSKGNNIRNIMLKWHIISHPSQFYVKVFFLFFHIEHN